MMQDSIARFVEQFDWMPVVENAGQLGSRSRYIVVGMGGSHLGAWLIKQYGPVPNITIHRDYGLPAVAEDELKDTLAILSSYSGNTEEVLDSGREARERGLSIAVIATGGKLLDFAREHRLPYVQMPDLGLQPRMATGLSMLGLAKLMGNGELEASIRTAGKDIDPMSSREEGSRIAGVILACKVPLIYASAGNLPLAYIWKIKFNETAKIPAFYNVFPELCHNELCGFDAVESTRRLSNIMHAIFLEDAADHPRNQKRMRIAGEILQEKGIPVERVKLVGWGFAKAFNAAILADWVSLDLARHYGVPDEAVPLIEEFKHRMA